MESLKGGDCREAKDHDDGERDQELCQSEAILPMTNRHILSPLLNVPQMDRGIPSGHVG